MQNGTVAIDIQAAPELIFDLIHDYNRRLEWDPFLREARLLDGASCAGIGVSSRCAARCLAGGLAMETVYVSFTRPTVAAVRMTRGPVFLRRFAASIRHQRLVVGITRVTYRYHFAVRPRSTAFFVEPLVARIFRRETDQRLAALKEYLESG